MNKKYFIKNTYNHRDSYNHYDDSDCEDEYQDSVYKVAFDIFKENNLLSIFDIGCGSGFKLIKYFSDFDFIGSEISPMYDWLKKNHPNESWVKSDFSLPINADMIICSDVIEHLVDPDILLNYLEKSNFKFLILSTPERDSVQIRQRGFLWDGPPANKAHVREWNFEEFEQYISSKFKIIDHFKVKSKQDHESKLCQLIVAKKL